MTAAPDTHTIAFIGDLHGNMTAFEYTLTAALRLRVTTIIQAGDFWIYDQPHHPDNLERVITVCGQLSGGGRDTRFQQRGQLFFRTSDTPPHRPPLHHRRRPHNNTDHTGRHTPTTPA
ncbi:hypothetical protein [Corynebacterium variabile]|nr:hypothetical protein [Corynebacterium variabile]